MFAERPAFAAEAAASADSAEERKDTTGVHPWRLHYDPAIAVGSRGGIKMAQVPELRPGVKMASNDAK
ncbi:MAG: hypothetical protein ACE10C_13125, partial [Candidatus Binatia bacterium]